jgi:hypothetical protein
LSFWLAEQRNGWFEKVVCGVQRVGIGGERRAFGLRIFERSHGKQRSIFLKKDDLAWLGRIVEEMVAVESSEIFWDQSRAGYPRMMA